MPDYLFTCYRQLTVLRDVCILSTAGRSSEGRSSEAFHAKMLQIYGYGVNVNRFCHWSPQLHLSTYNKQTQTWEFWLVHFTWILSHSV